MEANKETILHAVVNRKTPSYEYDGKLVRRQEALIAMEEYANAKLHLLQQKYEQLRDDINNLESNEIIQQDRFEVLQQEYDKLKGENEKTCHALANLAKQYKASNDLATEHAALKVKAEKMETALKEILHLYTTVGNAYQMQCAALLALRAYNSQTNNQNENNGA